MAVFKKEANFFTWSNFFAIVIGVVLLLLLQGPVTRFFNNVLVEYAARHSLVLLNLLLFIFVTCSLILIGIIYWLAWDNKKLKSKVANYVSKLVCKDYYQEQKRVRYDQYVASQGGDGSRKLDVGTEFFEGQVHERVKGPDLGVGKVEEEGIYLDGKFTGMRRVCFANGQKKEEMFLRNGLVHGTMRTYYEDGRLHHEKNFKDGKLNGVYKSFDEDGAPFFEITYMNDKQHGLDRTFYRNGRLQYEDTYLNGSRVHRKTFDEGGSLKFEQDYDH